MSAHTFYNLHHHLWKSKEMVILIEESEGDNSVSIIPYATYGLHANVCQHNV